MTNTMPFPDALNAAAPNEFVDTLGFLFEHSPWVVERAAPLRPFASVDAAMAGFAQTVTEASDAEKLALLTAHPELAGKEAIDRNLTAESTAEQASAGLDKLTDEEFAQFQQGNGAYRETFGFPFIICVRNYDKASILAAMHTRLHNDKTTEFEAALTQVLDIVRLRLTDFVASRPAGEQSGTR